VTSEDGLSRNRSFVLRNGFRVFVFGWIRMVGRDCAAESTFSNLLVERHESWQQTSGSVDRQRNVVQSRCGCMLVVCTWVTNTVIKTKYIYLRYNIQP
jgi:hypothetical protein